jgi:hypothetical protein
MPWQNHDYWVLKSCEVIQVLLLLGRSSFTAMKMHESKYAAELVKPKLEFEEVASRLNVKIDTVMFITPNYFRKLA